MNYVTCQVPAQNNLEDLIWAHQSNFLLPVLMLCLDILRASSTATLPKRFRSRKQKNRQIAALLPWSPARGGRVWRDPQDPLAMRVGYLDPIHYPQQVPSMRSFHRFHGTQPHEEKTPGQVIVGQTTLHYTTTTLAQALFTSRPLETRHTAPARSCPFSF